MPIISPIEARSLKGRGLLLSIIILLSLGAVTTVYPFLVMVGGSITSEMDAADMQIVPRYLYNNDFLYRKFLETKYNQNVSDLNFAHGISAFSFRDAAIPSHPQPQQAELVKQFFAENHLPLHWQNLGGIKGNKTSPEALQELRNRLRDYFHDNMSQAGKALGTSITSWLTITLTPPNWLDGQYNYVANPLYDTYFQMVESADPVDLQLVSVTGYFLKTTIYPAYGETGIPAYNRDHVHQIASYSDFEIPQYAPSDQQPQLRREWIDFVRNTLNPSFAVVDSSLTQSYQQYLKDRYETLEQLNHNWDSSFTAFTEIILPDGEHWLRGAQRVDYRQFIQTVTPEKIKLVGPEFTWKHWLTQQAEQGVDVAGLGQRIPVEQLEYTYVLNHSGQLRWRYIARNFIIVLQQLVFQGRTLINTVIVCALTIILALLINPMAAYAMSRFQQPWSYKVLLAMMATISFPPMVTTIPTFIMLRQIGWLNTYWALVIPMAANGYMVFLLKGFFDSIPRELYEAAELDGFSEMRMFFQLTLALSKPILAVVALGAFTSAYTMFLYAIIVSPSTDMWIISVWLYQFQEQATSSIVYASILIAAIPTMIMFLLTQNVIMRGIVVPQDK